MSGIYLHIKPNGHLEQQTRSHLNFNQYEYEELDILILVLNNKKKLMLVGYQNSHFSLRKTMQTALTLILKHGRTTYEYNDVQRSTL